MSLRLGTFNVWGLPEAFSDDVSSRMRALGERLEHVDLDVLLIQEAWTEEVRDTIRSDALAAGFEVAEGQDANGGLMTLSRVPIERARFERFRFRGDPERLAQGEFLGGKGFQTLELSTASGPLTLINTHLHARYRRERPRLNSAVRTAQLLQVIGALHDIEGTVVVGGDFNCSPGDAEYEIFRALADVVEVDSGLHHPTLSKTNFYKTHRTGRDKRIDFLFVRPGSDVQWTATAADQLFAETARIRRRDRSLSDHYGFRAEIDWAVQPSDKAWLAGHTPDPQAFDRARGLLEVGRREADRRERAHFRFAGGWVGASLLAAGLRRHPSLDRRHFLRGAASISALFALAPALGYGTLARVDSDYKRNAFDDADDVLAQLESRWRRADSA